MQDIHQIHEIHEIHEIQLLRFNGDTLPRVELPWSKIDLKKHCVPHKGYGLCYSWKGREAVLALYEITGAYCSAYPLGRFVISFALPARINGRAVDSEWACDALYERESQEYYDEEIRRHVYGPPYYA